MNLTDNLLGDAWYWSAWLGWLICIIRSVWQAPWRRLADSAVLNVWLGMVVLLTVVWSLKAGVKPGLSFHLLGATVFTLCFGPALAFVGLSLVTLGVTLNGDAGWFAFGVNALLLAGAGVALTQLQFRMLVARLPPNLFAYLFVIAFVGAVLAIIGVGFLATVLLGFAGAYPWEYLWNEYFPYFFLLAFSEAWLSGMCMTLFVVYKPQWVVTFDDSRYLSGK